MDILQTRDAVYANMRVINYPDGSKLVMVSDRAIFRRPGFEHVKGSGVKKIHTGDPLTWAENLMALFDSEAYMALIERQGKQMGTSEFIEAQKKESAQRLARSVRRAKAMLRDYVKANDWDYFVTLTLDRSKVDRYDIGEITRKLNQWADNQVRRNGLAYVLVPELHKDGAIHFHGFFRGGPPGVDSGTLTRQGQKRPRRPRSLAERERMLSDGWQPVFNLPAWTLGFTTAIRPYGDKDKATNYVLKYLTKEAERTGKIGGRWYYSGGDLKKPEVTLGEGDFMALSETSGAYNGTIDELGARICIFRIDAPAVP